MSKIKLLLDLADSMKVTADCITAIANAMKEPPAPPKPRTPVTRETVRELAVRLAKNGKRDDIKGLLDDYGVKNLTAVADDDLETFYAELAAKEVM